MFDWDCKTGYCMGRGYSHWGVGGMLVEMYLYLCTVIITKILLEKNAYVCATRRVIDYIYTPILSGHLTRRLKPRDCAVLLANCWSDYQWDFWMTLA